MSPKSLHAPAEPARGLIAAPTEGFRGRLKAYAGGPDAGSGGCGPGPRLVHPRRGPPNGVPRAGPAARWAPAGPHPIRARRRRCRLSRCNAAGRIPDRRQTGWMPVGRWRGPPTAAPAPGWHRVGQQGRPSRRRPGSRQPRARHKEAPPRAAYTAEISWLLPV